MFVNLFFLASNPFFDAFIEADILGRAIFIFLLFLSILSWVLILFKTWRLIQMRHAAQRFQVQFHKQRPQPLHLEIAEESSNPFLELYRVLKSQTLELLHKNRAYGRARDDETLSVYLSPTDIDFVAGQLSTGIARQIKQLEQHLFLLSTTVTLAPFLGLLGTVWGILISFSEMSIHSGGNTTQAVIGGLSLALAATVLGLLDAIPALIGYNYLKQGIRDFETEMHCFSQELLSSVEIQYRQVDLA